MSDALFTLFFLNGFLFSQNCKLFILLISGAVCVQKRQIVHFFHSLSNFDNDARKRNLESCLKFLQMGDGVTVGIQRVWGACGRLCCAAFSLSLEIL